MTSTHPTDRQRVEHARRVLGEASNGLLVADWGTLYWIAEQVPQLLDVIDHLTLLGNDRVADEGDPLATVPPHADGSPMCEQCAQHWARPGDKYCGDVCERNDRVSEHRGWSR